MSLGGTISEHEVKWSFARNFVFPFFKLSPTAKKINAEVELQGPDVSDQLGSFVTIRPLFTFKRNKDEQLKCFKSFIPLNKLENIKNTMCILAR